MVKTVRTELSFRTCRDVWRWAIPSMTLCWMPRRQSGSGWMPPKNAAYLYPDPSLLEDVEVPEGSALTSVLLVRTPRNRPSVRVNLVLDADIADTIISEAKRRGMTRKAYVEHLVRLAAQVGA